NAPGCRRPPYTARRRPSVRLASERLSIRQGQGRKSGCVRLVQSDPTPARQILFGTAPREVVARPGKPSAPARVQEEQEFPDTDPCLSWEHRDWLSQKIEAGFQR